MLTETVSCRFGETYSRLPMAGSVDLRLRTLKLPYSKYSLGANVVRIPGNTIFVFAQTSHLKKLETDARQCPPSRTPRAPSSR